MAIVKLANQNLLIDTPRTYLAENTSVGVTTIAISNGTGFVDGQLIIIGELGSQGAEIVAIDNAVVPADNSLDITPQTIYPHSASSPVRVIQYDQVEFSTATTVGGSKSVLDTVPLWANNESTNYIDNSGATGYYFGRFYNSVADTFSGYSDPIPVDGYGLYSARTIIDSALSGINKQTSEVLSDAYAFQELDSCQTECLRELKRWSFMQKFDSIVGQVSTGAWKFPMPTDLDDQNTNKSIYTFRIGTQTAMIWVDKAKFDQFLDGVGYSTVSTIVNEGDTQIILEDTNDFENSTSGNVTIGAYTYEYSANDQTTGTLTLTTPVAAGQGQPVGADAFQGATQGLPAMWTTYGGDVYYWPTAANTYNGLNIFGNYYTKQVQITNDSTNIIIPDPVVAINYLSWKFLRKLNNGEETEASLAFMNQFLKRLEKMKQKETMNRNFKFRPRFQNFATRSSANESTPRWIRDANFPNTGF